MDDPISLRQRVARETPRESPAELRRTFARWQRLSATDVARPHRTDLEQARLDLTRALDRIGRPRSHEVRLPVIDLVALEELRTSIDELRADA